MVSKDSLTIGNQTTTVITLIDIIGCIALSSHIRVMRKIIVRTYFASMDGKNVYAKIFLGFISKYTLFIHSICLNWYFSTISNPWTCGSQPHALSHGPFCRIALELCCGLSHSPLCNTIFKLPRTLLHSPFCSGAFKFSGLGTIPAQLCTIPNPLTAMLASFYLSVLPLGLVKPYNVHTPLNHTIWVLCNFKPSEP